LFVVDLQSATKPIWGPGEFASSSTDDREVVCWVAYVCEFPINHGHRVGWLEGIDEKVLWQQISMHDSTRSTLIGEVGVQPLHGVASLGVLVKYRWLEFGERRLSVFSAV